MRARTERRPALLAAAAFTGAAALAGAACEPLEPLVSDEPGASVHVLPPGSRVPLVEENLELARQIRLNDGLSDMALEESGGVVPLAKGYAKGAEVLYWDLGDAPRTNALLFRLVRRDGEAWVRVDHPLIADSLPGARFYSPFWMVQNVEVTSRWQGHVLPSAEAIADAVDLGLVKDPEPALLWADGPIVPKGTVFSRGEGALPLTTTAVYAYGHVVDMFLIGGDGAFREQEKPGQIPRGDVHQLLVGSAVNPAKEPVFQNQYDPWTPGVRIIQCRVTAPDPMDPTSKIVDEAQLFSRSMMGSLASATSRVISWTTTTTNKNWPIYAGGTP